MADYRSDVTCADYEIRIIQVLYRWRWVCDECGSSGVRHAFISDVVRSALDHEEETGHRLDPKLARYAEVLDV